MLEVRGQGFGHPVLDFLPGSAEREDTFDVGGVRAPTAIVGLFVDHQVLLHRNSSKPVARRIAPRVPAGTVSESLPATVTDRVPSRLSQISCDPVCRTRVHPI